MSQSLAQIYLHVVFSTKNRRPLLHDIAVRNEAHHFLGGICNNLDAPDKSRFSVESVLKMPCFRHSFRGKSLFVGHVNLGCPVLRVGGVADHVHILCRLGRTISVADLVKELKRESSQWLKTKSPDLADFFWQSGYGAFSLSPGHIDALRHYIANQEEHHRKESFQEEFCRLLTKPWTQGALAEPRNPGL